jgi:two-component system sensor histidine kinase BaeS
MPWNEDGQPRRRPPWWPESEEWPPTRRPWGPGSGWRRRGRLGPGGWGPPWSRRGFFLRVGAGIVAFGTFLVLLTALAVAVVAGLLGLVGLPVEPRLGAVVLVALGLLLILRGGRSVRYFAAPIGDLVEAAGAIESGDYSVRVAERGPREVRSLTRAFNEMGARLQSDEETRRTLLADITHELRTPLTVIQGNLEGLIDGIYPADEAHLTAILDESRTLSRLIDDLRTLALADRGALDLRLEDVDLLTLVNETVASMRPSADAAGLSITVAPTTAAVPSVTADPTRIREVLTNLTGNAIQHTPKGGAVTISLSSARGANGGRGSISVAVADTGSGIDPDVLPTVFERFVRSADSSGSGLGLAIARGLVEAHGGSIEASNNATGGATLCFSLPLGPGR